MDKEFYRGLLDQVSDGVYFVSRDRRITYWNRGAERITGYLAEEVVGHSCSEGILRHVNEAGRQLCLHGCPLAGVMKDGKDREAHVYLHHKSGHRVPVTVRGSALRDETGRIVGSVEVFSSRAPTQVADSRRSGRDDSIDVVTGLPIRAIGALHLETMVRAVNEETMTMGVLFIDVDHFKAINDTFGHVTGDEVLRMVGRSLASGLRRDDLAIRWGGEEFLTLHPGIKLTGLEATAERVRMLVENSWIQRGDRQARVTVSIGATMSQPANTATELLERADRLMYRSKDGGRNRVTSEGGSLVSRAEAPILGAGIPWHMPGLVDQDGFGDGDLAAVGSASQPDAGHHSRVV